MVLILRAGYKGWTQGFEPSHLSNGFANDAYKSGRGDMFHLFVGMADTDGCTTVRFICLTSSLKDGTLQLLVWFICWPHLSKTVHFNCQSDLFVWHPLSKTISFNWWCDFCQTSSFKDCIFQLLMRFICLVSSLKDSTFQLLMWFMCLTSSLKDGILQLLVQFISACNTFNIYHLSAEPVKSYTNCTSLWMNIMVKYRLATLSTFLTFEQNF